MTLPGRRDRASIFVCVCAAEQGFHWQCSGAEAITLLPYTSGFAEERYTGMILVLARLALVERWHYCRAMVVS